MQVENIFKQEEGSRDHEAQVKHMRVIRNQADTAEAARKQKDAHGRSQIHIIPY